MSGLEVARVPETTQTLGESRPHCQPHLMAPETHPGAPPPSSKQHHSRVCSPLETRAPILVQGTPASVTFVYSLDAADGSTHVISPQALGTHGEGSGWARFLRFYAPSGKRQSFKVS